MKFTKNWPLDEIKKYLEIPLNLGMTMVACGDVDGLVAGANNTTSDVIRSAIRIVGIQQNSKWISSIFFMISPNGEKAYTFLIGVIPEPTSEQLAAIAKDASEFHELLSGDESSIAFLSFSTKGSASHYRVDRVRDAVRILGKNLVTYLLMVNCNLMQQLMLPLQIKRLRIHTKWKRKCYGVPKFRFREYCL